MPSSEIDVQSYNGSLLVTDLLSSGTNLVLSSFGPTETGTVTDDDGTLSQSDASSFFNGQPLTYIGSGSATPGIEVAGLLLATGPTVDVVAFESGGEVYFHYPSGEPSSIGGPLLLNVELTTDPYEVFTPVCFCSGTMIATPSGETAVEDLQTGDEVLDHEGATHVVRWTGTRRMVVPDLPAFEKWLPVHIAADALAPGLPSRATRVSQQHRILLQGWRAELLTGHPEGLTPARALVDDATVRIDRACRIFDYHHIACDRHVVLVANGLPAESLYPGGEALDALTEEGRQELLGIFPEALADGPGVPMAAPVIRAFEARLFRAMAPGKGPSRPPRKRFLPARPTVPAAPQRCPLVREAHSARKARIGAVRHRRPANPLYSGTSGGTAQV